MGWNVWLEVRSGNDNVLSTDGFHFTHNTNPMIQAAGFEDFLEADGWNCERFCNKLKKLIMELESKPDFYAEYDAPNGWGTYEHLLACLRSIYEEFHKHTLTTVRMDK